MENLTYKPITKNLIKIEPRINEVYLSSFPERDRVPWSFLLKKSSNKNMDFLAFYDEGKFVGFTYLISTTTKLYILYLAIDDKVRSKGYGSRILNIIKQLNDRTIFLSIEEVAEKHKDYSTRKKRLEFYQKNGFAKNDYSLKEMGQIFETLSFNGGIVREDLIDAFAILIKPMPKFVLKWVIK